MSDVPGPLLTARSVRFVGALGQPISGPPTCSVQARSLALVGEAKTLLGCLIQPELLLEGQLELCDQDPLALLARGEAAVAPRELPAPRSLRLGETLALSARLIGRGPSDVAVALGKVQLASLARRKLADLSPLQHRLAGIAHALIGDPQLLLLDDPFADLSDDGCELVELVLETETATRSWIASLATDSPWSRRLLQAAEQALSARLGALVGPLTPRLLATDAYWARFRRTGPELEQALAQAGAELVVTPHPTVLLVRKLGGKDIARAALSSGSALLELCPARELADPGLG